jgi:hypothetical protein
VNVRVCALAVVVVIEVADVPCVQREVWMPQFEV